jgi:pimeloyl-ACP methyl ester carboxylesterase
MTKRSRKRWMVSGMVMLLLLGAVWIWLPAIGAGILLHPPHRRVVVDPPPSCVMVKFAGEGVELKGWRSQGTGGRRGTVIYLHGVADNRASGAGVMTRFRKRGFDVVAYDSRAHGESGGDACTYGYFEKLDLQRVMDTVGPGPVVLIGSSLGGSVALQLAASDRRISAVVAAETFSDLRTVATERAPFFLKPGLLVRAFGIVEQNGRLQIDAVSPAKAAPSITAPVLLIHGAADVDTPPDHTRRVFEALTCPKKMILVPGARHNESLHGEIWGEIERWVDQVLDSSSDGHTEKTSQ